MTVHAQPELGMVLKGYPRISETFISNEILLLERMGFKVHIFSMRNPRESFTHESVREIRADVDYLPQTIFGPHFGLLVRHNLRQALKNPKAYFKALKMVARRYARTRKTACLKHLLQAGYLVNRLLPGTNVRRLHAQFAHTPTSVTMYAAMLSGLPFGFTGHAKDIYTSHPVQLREKIEAADFVVTCTNYNRRYLQDISKDASTPIHCIYHGIDLNLFSNSHPRTDPAPPYKILTVARFTPKKGLPTVLKAVRRLKDQGLDVEHIMIGTGDDKEKILKLIKELGLEETTRCIGVQPHDVVLDHYRKADVFVLGCEISPNGDRDGIPNVLVEAMAMSVPVIATQVSAIPELVENEKTGLLVPPKNPEALAQAMTRLLTDHDLREKIIPAAKEKVHQGFENQAWTRELAKIYRQAGL